MHECDCACGADLALTFLAAIETLESHGPSDDHVWEAIFFGDADFVRGSNDSVPGDLTLTRASTATVQTFEGTITRNIAVDKARGHYAGNSLAHDFAYLLIEETRTNLNRWSRQYDLQTIQAGTVVTANTEAGPAGDSTADTVDLTAAALNTGVYDSVVHGLGAVAPIQLSAWLKPTAGTPNVNIRNPNTGLGEAKLLDVVWARYTFSTDTGANPSAGVHLARNTAAAIYAWGSQMERGLFPTSPIETVAASVTRAADILTHANVLSLVNGGRLSFEIDCYPLGASTEYETDRFLWAVNATNYLRYNAASQTLTLAVGGFSFSATDAVVWSRGDRLRLFVRWDGTNLRVDYNSDAAGYDSLSYAAPLPTITASGTVHLLCDHNGANQFSAAVAELRAWRLNEYPSWVTP
jgi:hypothetical protein